MIHLITRSTGRRTRANGRLTAERLLAAGRRELARSGPIDFNVEEVLRRSQVSRSSFYHHFGSRDDLIVALEFERLCDELLVDMELTRSLVLGAANAESAMKMLLAAIEAGATPTARDRRRRRVQSLAASYSSRALRSAVHKAQTTGTNHLLETLSLWANKRGRPFAAPVEGIAYVVQSLLIGRILVDVADDSSLDAAYSATCGEVLQHILRPAPAGRRRA